MDDHGGTERLTSMWRKLSKCYPPALEFMPLFLLIVAIYVAFSCYPSLPERIPIDFDSQGIAVEWASKTFIFLYACLGVFVYGPFSAANILFAVTGNPKSLMNIPRRWKDSLSDSQTELLRSTFNRHLFILKALIMCLMLCLLYSSKQVALEKMSGIGGLVFTLLILAIVAAIFLMVWRITRIVRMPRLDGD